MEPCIEWPKGRFAKGYGMQVVAGKVRRAHRVAWEAARGPIAPGLEIHHICGNRACVNVDHMQLLTRAQHRRLHAWAQDHCKRGHAFDEANTARRNGKRICRVCDRERMRARRRSSPMSSACDRTL